MPDAEALELGVFMLLLIEDNCECAPAGLDRMPTSLQSTAVPCLQMHPVKLQRLHRMHASAWTVSQASATGKNPNLIP